MPETTWLRVTLTTLKPSSIPVWSILNSRFLRNELILSQEENCLRQSSV
jgi:hypothetical protein